MGYGPHAANEAGAPKFPNEKGRPECPERPNSPGFVGGPVSPGSALLFSDDLSHHRRRRLLHSGHSGRVHEIGMDGIGMTGPYGSDHAPSSRD
jgi:hypothetical protein